jgi:diguanylate cyclase (GGDEF)-like protein/PAS domain S-box-containing protein
MKLAETEGRLAEAQQVLGAIRAGEVDAIVVSGPQGEQVFTLKGAEYAYRSLVEAMKEGAAMVDCDGIIVYCNQYLSDLLDTPLEQIIGHPCGRLFRGKHHQAFQNLFARAQSEEVAPIELKLRSSCGNLIPAYISLRRMAADGPAALCMVLTDLSEIKKAEAMLARLSHQDPLTELPNRRMFTEQLASWWELNAGLGAAILFLDIDNFKTVNDSLGHAVGDELLRQIAHRLAVCVGPAHLVARLGGDEFVVFCRDTSIAQAEQLAGAIIDSFGMPFMLDERPFRTTTSIGIARVPNVAPDDTATPLREADLAMYAAKKKGGNHAMVFEPPDHDKVLRKLMLEQGLFCALDRNELVLEYQSQVVPSTGELLGFEALLRWNHPVYGRISPLEFIPLAEASGQIVPLGAWVLRQALFQIQRWRALSTDRLTVSVNVSALQVFRADFMGMVERCLAESGVPGSALRLEVTESIFMHDTAILHLNQVRTLGLHISVDDFGTGYSALSYLQRLPIDEVKLDKSLLNDVDADPRKMALFRAIVNMAHTLDFTVVAEGVETESQRACLSTTDCDAAQGYLFARPLPPDAVERTLGYSFREMPLPDASGSTMPMPPVTPYISPVM